MADALNNHFVDKVHNLVANMPPQSSDILATLLATPNPPGNELQLMELTIQKLDKYIRSMKKNSSSEIDSICGRILNDVYESTKRIILHIINLSMCLGIFPTLFKLTKITPILKACKNQLDPASYRPVANLCSVGKLLEAAVMDQVKDHLVKNNFWNNNQHGSRVKHSTTTCVCEILEDSNKANEKGLMTAVTAVNMSSTFDLIDHKVLIQKCRIALLGNAGLTWLIDFLDNWSQMVM